MGEVHYRNHLQEVCIMDRKAVVILCLTLIGSLTVFPLFGKTHKFQLVEKASLCGVNLEPGYYTLKLSEDVAGIYLGSRLLVTAKVRTEQMRGETPNSCRCFQNILTEVRLDTEKVVFLERVDSP
jgi:hypothetical protein